jgi:hypothetical protein
MTAKVGMVGIMEGEEMAIAWQGHNKHISVETGANATIFGLS